MDYGEIRRCLVSCRFTDHTRREMEAEPLGRIHDVSARPRAVGAGFQKEEAVMHCVICKRGEVKPAPVEAELKVGSDHLLVLVDAEVCVECGEAYYSTKTMRYLEHVREAFEQKALTPT